MGHTYQHILLLAMIKSYCSGDCEKSSKILAATYRAAMSKKAVNQRMIFKGQESGKEGLRSYKRVLLQKYNLERERFMRKMVLLCPSGERGFLERIQW